MYISEINIDGLKAIYDSKPAAKSVIDYFTTCSANENVVTVDDLQSFFQKKQYVIARQDVVNLFKDLEELRVGEFKIGRRTQKTRFVSKISLSSIGHAVVNGNKTEEVNQEIEELQQKPEKALEVAQKTESSQSSVIEKIATVNKEVIGNFLTHSFPLRPNLVISLDLPVDLTDTEAERLSSFIKTLPFN